MAPKVEITDRDGWRKEFPMEKTLLHIGSDARNDLVLDARRGSGVAPRHLQLVTLPGSTPGLRVINLSDRDISIEKGETRSILPRSAMDIADGDCLHLGDFRLVFRLDAGRGTSMADPPLVTAAPMSAPRMAPARSVAAPLPYAGGVEKTSSHIGLRLSFPQTWVEPGQPLYGTITVRNLGDEPGVQFRLEVEGLNPDSYEIGQGPILFPQVEKEVPLRLHHPQGPGLTAGRHLIQIHASAPDAYRGERVSVSQEIEIAPYFCHTLTLAAVD